MDEFTQKETKRTKEETSGEGVGSAQICCDSMTEVLAIHSLYKKADELSRDVIGAAIEVHRDKGPGLLESIYEWCLTMELGLRGHAVRNQKDVVVTYKEFKREYPLKFDLLINECLLIEIKSVSEVLPIHKAQLLSYMKLLDVPVGLLINFNEQKLVDGVARLILPGANQD